MILMIGLLLSQSFNNSVKAENSASQISLGMDSLDVNPVVLVMDDGANPITLNKVKGDKETSGNFLLDNWGAILLGLLGFFDLIARLTPTEKDNSIVNFLMSLFNTLIPNLKKGGGSFRLLSK